MGNGEFKVSEQKWKDLFEGRLVVFVLLLDIHHLNGMMIPNDEHIFVSGKNLVLGG